MKTINDIKKMIKEPASKEWFAKHGGVGEKKKEIAKKMKQKKPTRYLTKEESEAKMKAMNFPSGGVKEPNHTDYQRKFGRAYND